MLTIFIFANYTRGMMACMGSTPTKTKKRFITFNFNKRVNLFLLEIRIIFGAIQELRLGFRQQKKLHSIL